MTGHAVAVARFTNDPRSVRAAIDLAGAFDRVGPGSRVFVKPNVVFWTTKSTFPKWGVITTSTVLEAVVAALRDKGARSITIGEGIVTFRPDDRETPKGAFESLGYNTLAARYGAAVVNIMEGPFKKVAVADGVTLNLSTHALESDFIVSVPPLKTHAQTVVSLGIKNLKGLIDRPSRKKCHSADPACDLHAMVSFIPDRLPPSATVIDGIYSLERGPSFYGSARRSNIIVASADTLSADMAGAFILGHPPATVPHLAHCANRAGRPLDLSDVQIRGESLESVRAPHPYSFPYNKEGTLPLPMVMAGIKGLAYRNFDLSLCTYCSHINGAILTAIAYAWKGVPWDDVEVLTGKTMEPTPGKKKTILLGQCMCTRHQNNPLIGEAIKIEGCPADPKDAFRALRTAGIAVSEGIFKNLDRFPGLLMGKYRRRPEFEEAFYSIP